jgi:hypothetical protein
VCLKDSYDPMRGQRSINVNDTWRVMEWVDHGRTNLVNREDCVKVSEVRYRVRFVEVKTWLHK